MKWPLVCGLCCVLLSVSLFASDEKTFTFCAEANPASFNSQLATDGATFNAASRTMYNRLVGFEKGSTRVTPSLAKSWTVSANGREIVFNLHQGVEFHTTDYFKPTRTFNADDVLFTFDRMRDKKHPFHKVGGGEYPSFQAQQMGEIIESIDKLGEYVVRFKLHRPEAPFLANLGMDFTSILSAEYGAQLMAQKKMEALDNIPIGTGPFVFVKYEKDKFIRYRAHEKYFEGRPKIDSLVFLITTDPALRLKRLKSNECQMAQDPAPESLDEIRNDKDLKLLSQPGLNISYIAFATERAPFSNLKVRKAINHALAREDYIQQVYGGNAQVAKNPIPSTMWSYNRHTQDYEYDIKKAKALLEEAGFAAGFETELWYSDVSRPYNPSPKKMAELVSRDLEKIGIKVKIKEWPWHEFLARSRKGEPPMSIQGWTGDNGDPDNFLNNLLSCQAIKGGNNRARWCDKKFSFLVDRARVTTNIRQRTKFYEEAQDVFKANAPWVTIAHSTVFRAVKKNVEGYHVSPFGVIEFHKVEFK